MRTQQRHSIVYSPSPVGLPLLLDDVVYVVTFRLLRKQVTVVDARELPTYLQ